jgi:hypothetical protein
MMIILNVITKVKKEFLLFAVVLFAVLLAELLLFNRDVIMDRFYRLKEQHYTIHDGTLYQMVLKNEKLVSHGPYPNITFKNIDMLVDRISITCTNLMLHERGQVFFRAAGQDFIWANSVSYETKTTPNTQIIDLPSNQMISSLRFDLTHSENDVVKCREFVINPSVPFNIRFRRVVVYLIFVMLTVFEITKKLLSKNGNPEEPFPSLSFQRLAAPLLAICLVFPDVVFLGASLRVTDQMQGSQFRFPPIIFYPHDAHQTWNAGLTDYYGGLYQSEPMMEFMVHSLHEAESPYWNPYSAAGSLGPETLVDNKFSVFTLVYAFLGGGQKTYNIVLLFLYFLAAYFTYRLIREKLQLSFLAGLAGMVFFLLNGYATANVGSNVTQSYLYIPMCLYTSISLIEKPNAFRISRVVLSFAVFFSCTFIPTTLTGFIAIYGVLVAYLLILYRKLQRNTQWLLRVLVVHGACICTSILLLAFIYFPVGENLHSTGTVSVYADRKSQFVSWIMIPSIFSSSHFFESYHAMEVGVREYVNQRDESNRTYHFGTTALTLAIGSVSLKRRSFLPFVLVCIVVILMGFGRVFGIPAISFLISRIPVISFAIADRYWWPIMVIPLILLVALGIDNLQNGFVIPGLPFFLLALLLGSLTAVGVVYGLREPNLWYKKWSIGVLIATGIVSTLATALSAYTSRKELRNYIASALIVLLFVELTMDSKTMRFAPDDLFANPPVETTFIKKNIGLYRTLTIGWDYGMWHELGSAFGIQEVTAINQGTLPNYINYFHKMISLDQSQRLNYNYYPNLVPMRDTPDINKIDWAAVNLLGIKYIITPRNFSQYRQVFINHGLVPVLDTGSSYIYENPYVLPRAFTVGLNWLSKNEAVSLSADTLSNLEPSDISLYRNNEVTLRGTVSNPALLILTDNWHPKWKAFVNGTQTNIILVNGTFRGVFIPAGPYEVRFYYEPSTLKVALFTSGMIFFLMLYILLDHKRIDGFLSARVAYL